MSSATISSDRDQFLLSLAIELARSSYFMDAVPIGTVLADEKSIISMGVNSRVQNGSMVMHAETKAIENAGRRAVERLRNSTAYCTLSPCAMCAGAFTLYCIKRVVIADRKNFKGFTGVLREAGIEVDFCDRSDAYELLRDFRTKNPKLWDEDNGSR